MRLVFQSVRVSDFSGVIVFFDNLLSKLLQKNSMESSVTFVSLESQKNEITQLMQTSISVESVW